MMTTHQAEEAHPPVVVRAARLVATGGVEPRLPRGREPAPILGPAQVLGPAPAQVLGPAQVLERVRVLPEPTQMGVFAKR